MHPTSFLPSDSPASDEIDHLTERVLALLPFEGSTISARVGGGLERMMFVLEMAGYTTLRSQGLDFDCTQDLEGNEILLVHHTKPSQLGEWGTLWRTVWPFAELPISQLGPLIRTLDVGICRIAECAQKGADTDQEAAA